MKFPLTLALTFSLATPALAIAPTGVEKCDALLNRYEACLPQLPKDKQHDAIKEILDGSNSIRANAGNPQVRPDMERFCDDTFAQMKKSSDIKECMSQEAPKESAK